MESEASTCDSGLDVDGLEKVKQMNSQGRMGISATTEKDRVVPDSEV